MSNPQWVSYDEKKMKKAGKSAGWSRGEGSDVFGNPNFGLVKHVMVMRDGAILYDGMLRLERGGGVFLPVMIDKSNQVYFGLQKQWRPQIADEAIASWQAAWPNITDEVIQEFGRESWEIPRGYSDLADKDTAETALREAEEETGNAVIRAVKRPHMNSNTALNPHMTGFVIGVLDPEKRSGREQDPDEAILSSVEWFTMEELAQLREKGLLYDTFTLAALFDFFFAMIDDPIAIWGDAFPTC